MRSVLERETIVSETALASKYKTVSINLWKLNDMLGIESSAEYTLRDDYNTDEFFNAYGTLQIAFPCLLATTSSNRIAVLQANHKLHPCIYHAQYTRQYTFS